MSKINSSTPDFLGAYERFLVSRIRMYRSVLMSDIAFDIELMSFGPGSRVSMSSRRFRYAFLRSRLFSKLEAYKISLREFHALSNKSFMSAPSCF